MELLGYKSLNNYNVYLGPEVQRMYYTMGEMGTAYNLDIFYNTQTAPQTIALSGESKAITIPTPDAAGKCTTETNPGFYLAWPLGGWVDYHISSGFGWREDPDTGACACHGGMDIVADAGTPILAAADGEVVFAGVGTPGSGYNYYGYVVSIYHEDYGYSTLYGHLLDNSITVKKGDFVKKGQVIGNLGSSGRSTGAHLHFEIDKGKGRTKPSNARNICVFLQDVPDECIHWDVDVCTKAGLTNTGATAQTIGMTTTVTKPPSGDDVTILPEDYVTEIPLPGAQKGYIKGVVGGLVA
jgi:murein DD-endopeptidase MepM/ murein hydrolase activator NlpD